MKKIFTTHTGSLPRPDSLLHLIRIRENGRELNPNEYQKELYEAVKGVVERQNQVGIDIINDGEMGKVTYATYVKDRINGFGGLGQCPGMGDIDDYPSYLYDYFENDGAAFKEIKVPACIGELSIKNEDDLDMQLKLLSNISEKVKHVDRFFTSASPGIIALYFQDNYYSSYDKYIDAITSVMKVEYEKIHKSGNILQLDCPDLAYGRHTKYFANKSLSDFKKILCKNINAINKALENIPKERVRAHICWGNYEGPHHKDVELKEIINNIMELNVGAVCLEAANPRHQHEWKVLDKVKIPDDLIIIPGVIDTCTNYIEHPEVVADRILHYIDIVGVDRVIAGTDCGFATFANLRTVDPEIAWSKLKSLTEGAKLAVSLV